MKKLILINIIFYCFASYGQTITPDSMIYIDKYKTKHGQKIVKSIIYCNKDSVPYTGHIKGEVIYDKYNYIGRFLYGHMSYIMMLIETDYFLNGFCPDCDSIQGLMIDGEFVDGKESGHWFFYNIKDSMKIAECNYIEGLFNGNIYIYEKNTNGEERTFVIEPFNCRHCGILFYNQKKLKKRSYHKSH